MYVTIKQVLDGYAEIPEDERTDFAGYAVQLQENGLLADDLAEKMAAYLGEGDHGL